MPLPYRRLLPAGALLLAALLAAPRLATRWHRYQLLRQARTAVQPLVVGLPA